MAAARPAKALVRKLWIDRVEAAVPMLSSSGPLYFTLPGAQGAEIGMLIDRGILKLNPTGSISDQDGRKVVALEASSKAEIELKAKYPGLKVMNQRVEDLLRTTSPFKWPDPRDEWWCRALVINLDLNEPLKCVNSSGQLTFPIVQLVAKLADLHAKEPVVDWTLCLTLNAKVGWDADVSVGVQKFMQENFGREPSFSAAARTVLGEEFYSALAGDAAVDWETRPIHEHQRLLMALLPKKIAQVLHGRGWRVDTAINYRYGGTDGAAPMATWILELHWDVRSTSTPDLVYREALQQVLRVTGQIEEDGSIS